MYKCFPAILAVAAAAAVAGPAAAQPTVGTYTYFWTNAADSTNTPITTLGIVPGGSATVRFWLRETGGTVLSAANPYGLGGYDANFTWTTGGTAGDANATGIYVTKVDGTNAGSSPAVSDIQVNPNVYGARGYNNTNNGLLTTTDTVSEVNAAKQILIGKLIGDTANPANWVKVTDGPNSTGNFLLTEMTFTTSAAFAGDSLTGRQRGTSNYLYYLNGTTPDALDSTIGTVTNAGLTFTVAPIPEPGTVLGVAAAGLAAARFARRRRAVPAAV